MGYVCNDQFGCMAAPDVELELFLNLPVTLSFKSYLLSSEESRTMVLYTDVEKDIKDDILQKIHSGAFACPAPAIGV